MSESPGSFIRNRANLRRDSAKLRLKRHPHAREWPATSVTGICSFQKCRSITRSPERPNVPSESRTSLDSRLSWARKMQSGLWLYSNTPSRRRNQLSRAKMNSAQDGRLWRFAPGKISMRRMEHPRCRPSCGIGEENPMSTEGGRTSQFSIKKREQAPPI